MDIDYRIKEELEIQQRLLSASNGFLENEPSIIREKYRYLTIIFNPYLMLMVLYTLSVIIIAFSFMLLLGFSTKMIGESLQFIMIYGYKIHILLCIPIIVFLSIITIIAIHNTSLFKQKKYLNLARQARLLLRKSEMIYPKKRKLDQ